MTSDYETHQAPALYGATAEAESERLARLGKEIREGKTTSTSGSRSGSRSAKELVVKHLHDNGHHDIAAELSAAFPAQAEIAGRAPDSEIERLVEAGQELRDGKPKTTPMTPGDPNDHR
jgi:hypothetical protein